MCAGPVPAACRLCEKTAVLGGKGSPGLRIGRAMSQRRGEASEPWDEASARSRAAAKRVADVASASERDEIGKRPARAAAAIARDVGLVPLSVCPPEILAAPPGDVDLRPVSRSVSPSPGRIDRDDRRVRWPDRAIAAVASRQETLITRRQLFALQLSRSAIDYSVMRGRLTVVHRGVYGVGPGPLSPAAILLAAVLACGEGALLSHFSAAARWGMVPARDGDVDVMVIARESGRRRAGIRVHRTAHLDPCDATRRDRIPITSAARALVDIAPRLGDRGLERAFDHGFKSRVLTRHAVGLTADRLLHRPGARRVAELAAAELPASTETRSRIEERFLRLVRAGGLPEPELNVPLGDYVVDALWRELGLVVEIDSYGFHGTRRSFESDRERDVTLGGVGWRVMRFTRDQIKLRPEWVLVQLTRELTKLQARPAR
jgi:very-short-patch-repair endonuclease